MRDARLLTLRTACALLGLLVGGCGGRGSAQLSTEAENALLDAIVSRLQVEAGEERLRIIARLLPAGSDLELRIHASSLPGGGGRDQMRDSTPVAHPSMSEAFQDALARHAVDMIDGFPSWRCPGAMAVATLNTVERGSLECPAEPMRIAVVSSPRPWEAYAPSEEDLAIALPGNLVYTSRVIVRHYTAGGYTEIAADMLFDLDKRGWRFLGRRDIMIVE